ncbi:uncharacterized protein [Dysidea avara]|uniref:uncharacterized protein isoform X2 n=1 Tax=Dysidea avara TaxID=196820 RepID=UPI0033216C2F
MQPYNTVLRTICSFAHFLVFSKMAAKDTSGKLKEATLKGVVPLDKELGRGAYGRVFTVKYRGLVCAAKEIHPLLLNGISGSDLQAVKDSFIGECLRCNDIRHPNIVQFMGVYYPSEEPDSLPVMVMELMDTSLASFVQNNQTNIATKEKFSILYDVSLGLTYLHASDPPIIHRDLSSNNVMLTSKLVAKIGDLGVAKAIRAESKQTRSKLTTAPGTLHFMPPESLDDVEPIYGTPVDVFSFGGIALHVFSEEWPAPLGHKKRDPNTRKMVSLTEGERRQPYLDKMTGSAASLKELVERCLDDDPDERPAIQEVSELIEPLMHTSSVDVKPCVNTVALSPGAPNSRPRKECVPPIQDQEQPNDAPSLVEALQSQQYHLKWTKCANLPTPIFEAFIAVDGSHVYVTGTYSLQANQCQVFHYDLTTDQWDRLPNPDHRRGVLCMVGEYLAIFGGRDAITEKIHNKVSTYNKDGNCWISYYPNMMKNRHKPGVVTYGDQLIAIGGKRDEATIDDSIEVMNFRQNTSWVEVSACLPIPMWAIKPTIAGEHLLIVGYGHADGHGSGSHQIPVAAITSMSSSDQVASQWEKLPSCLHYYTTTVPYSNPPLIIGGDVKGVPTSDISLYDTSKKSWILVDSLTSARSNVGVATINSNTIIVIGGYTKGGSIVSALSSSMSTVEIGHIVHN